LIRESGFKSLSLRHIKNKKALSKDKAFLFGRKIEI
jgi:hypothetical protein